MKKNCVVDCLHARFSDLTYAELGLSLVCNSKTDSEPDHQVWIFSSLANSATSLSSSDVVFSVNNTTTHSDVSLFDKVIKYVRDSFNVIGSCNTQLLELILPDPSERHRRGVNISPIEIHALDKNNWAIRILNTHFCQNHHSSRRTICAAYRACKFALFIQLMLEDEVILAQDIYSSHRDQSPFRSVDKTPFLLFENDDEGSSNCGDSSSGRTIHS